MSHSPTNSLFDHVYASQMQMPVQKRAHQRIPAAAKQEAAQITTLYRTIISQLPPSSTNNTSTGSSFSKLRSPLAKIPRKSARVQSPPQSTLSVPIKVRIVTQSPALRPSKLAMWICWKRRPTGSST
jgi:hypothetical protein